MKVTRIHFVQLTFVQLIAAFFLIMSGLVKAQTVTKGHIEPVQPMIDYEHLPNPTLPFWKQEDESGNVEAEKSNPKPVENWILQSIFRSSKGYLAIINGKSYRQGDALMPAVYLRRFEKNAVWLDKKGEEIRLSMAVVNMSK